MVEQTRIWRAGDEVKIECDDQTLPGVIIRASPSGVSLMLGFEAILGNHVAYMPVLRHDDGVYRSIITGIAVTVSPIEETSS